MITSNYRSASERPPIDHDAGFLIFWGWDGLLVLFILLFQVLSGLFHAIVRQHVSD